MVTHNLPPQATSFIGRTHELAEIAVLLANPACRLLTLVGPGGIGKTRLAMEVASRKSADFSDGILFVPLAPISNADNIHTAIAGAFNINLDANTDAAAQILNYLRERTLLLVLDNFEHLLDGATFVTTILRAAPGVRILATSRTPLNLQDEWLWQVKGMPFPDDENSAQFSDYDAVQLFAERARRVRNDFDIGREALHVIHICQLVEGMPLAVELSVGWLKTLSCRQVGNEIQRNLDILVSPARDAPTRHRSIRAVFDHSWNMLTNEQQAVFRRLSVFRGGFTLDAVEKIAGASLWMLASLVDKSLLHFDIAGRYGIHELLRQYGEEKLEVVEEIETIRNAHSVYYANFLHERVEDLKGRRQIEAMAEINADFENVRAAWNRAVAYKREDIINLMIEGLWVFGEISNREQEVWALFGYAKQQFAPERGSEPQQIWGRLLARADETEAFQAHLETALSIARCYDDLAEIAFCLKQLGSAAYGKRDFAKARELLEQCLTIYRQAGDRYAIAGILITLMSYNYEPNWDDFRRYGEESLRLRREIGDRVGAAVSLTVVAIGEARIGHFAEAEHLWLERIAVGYQTGIGRLIAVGKAQVSHQVYFIQGDFVRARSAAEEALKMATTIYPAGAIGWELVTLGLLANMEERYQEGKTLCEQAASVATLTVVGELAAWSSSIASCGLGDYDTAQEFLSVSLNHMTDNRGLVGMIACLPVAAIILAHNGQKVHAVELLGFAFTHPVRASGWMEKWPLLTRFRAELEQALGAEEYSEAWERGKLLDTERVKVELQVRFAPKGDANQSLEEPLTEREREVLRLVALGLSNREIADQLVLAISTIKWHLGQIFSKLHVSNRAQAVLRAKELKLLS